MKKKTVIDPHSSFEQLKGPIRSTKCKPLRRIILDQKCTLTGNFLLYISIFQLFHEPKICGLLDLPSELMFALII